MSKPGPDEIGSVEGPEAVVSADEQEAIDTGAMEESDIVDLAQTPDSAEFQAEGGSDVIDLAGEPEIVRLDAESGDEPEIVRIEEDNGIEAPVISEWSRETPDPSTPAKDQTPRGMNPLALIGKIRDFALLPLAKVRGILKRDPRPADDMESPGAIPAAPGTDGSGLSGGWESDAAGASVPGPIEAGVTDDPGAYDLAGAIQDVGGSEAVDLTQVPAVEAGDDAAEDIVDIAQGPEPAGLPIVDDSDLVDLTGEPEVVRPDEEDEIVRLEDEPEVVRIGEEAGLAADQAVGMGAEEAEPPLPEGGREARGKSLLEVLGRLRDLSLLPLVKLKGVFKKEKPAAVALGPGFELGGGPEKVRRRFSIPKPVVKALTIIFVIVCLAAGGLVGLKASQIYSSRFTAQPGEPGTQTPAEATNKETARTPAASSRPAVPSEAAKPTVQQPVRPTIQQPTKPATEQPASPSAPGTVAVPDTGKYDEPPYSKDVYKKGAP